MIVLTANEYENAFVEWSGISSIDEAIACDRRYGAGSVVAYAKWCEEQGRAYEEHGALASAPLEMECYGCGGFNGKDSVTRKVVALGPVIEPWRDATQSYRLVCGHTVI